MEAIQIQSNVQFASIVDNLMREILKDILIPEKGASKDDPIAILWGDEIHINLKIMPNSLSEENLEGHIKTCIEPLGIDCIPYDCDLRYMINNGKRLGKFNIDIYPGPADILMVTFARLNFN